MKILFLLDMRIREAWCNVKVTNPCGSPGLHIFSIFLILCFHILVYKGLVWILPPKQKPDWRQIAHRAPGTHGTLSVRGLLVKKAPKQSAFNQELLLLLRSLPFMCIE